MPTTPILALPYPSGSDPADVPTDMNELATRIETVRGSSNGLASLGADGKVPAAQLPAPVARELNYGERTSNLVVPVASAGSAAAAIAVVATPSLTFDGTTAALIEFFVGLAYLAAQGTLVCTLWDGATDRGTFVQVSNPGTGVTGSLGLPLYASRRLTPSAGAHTFTVKAWTVGADTTLYAGPGAAATDQQPTFIRVTRAA